MADKRPLVRGSSGAAFSNHKDADTLVVKRLDAPADVMIIGAAASNLTIGNSGGNTTIYNLITAGPTTIIPTNELVVNDAVIHVNHAEGPDAPVPSGFVGLAIHRGDVSATPRDHVLIGWDETNSQVVFARDTNGNEAIASYAAIKSGSATVDGALSQSNGTFSLLSTSTGVIDADTTLDITSTGAMVIDGTGVTIKGGGTNALVVSGDASTITVQTGSTLQTTGSGMINLPSQFKINGSAVSTNVNATNLNELTGGGVTSLHTHAATPSTSVVISGLTTTGLASGDSVYISAANTMTKTTSTTEAGAGFAGIYDGTTGEIIVAGKVNAAKFTTDGGQPANGALVFVAASTADSGAGAGKLTATPPADGSGLFLMVAARVLSNANYASAKTCVVQVLAGNAMPVEV